MKTLQTVITQPDALGTALSALVELKPDWIQVFGSLRYLTQPDFVPTLRAAFPDALLTG